MGRIKQGLDYFPMSTSFMHDRIVRRVMKREGDAAFATLVETLSYIYAVLPEKSGIKQSTLHGQGEDRKSVV